MHQRGVFFRESPKCTENLTPGVDARLSMTEVIQAVVFGCVSSLGTIALVSLHKVRRQVSRALTVVEF
jgi:hypothetical protein